MKILGTEDAVAQSKYDALTQSELRIKQASANTLESIRIIGSELIKIQEEGLYEVLGHNDLKEYVEFHLNLSWDMAKRWMRVSQAFTLLEDARMQLPSNESQVIELAKLKAPDTLVNVWGKILQFCSENRASLTYDLVKDAVSAQRTKAGQRRTRPSRKKSLPPIGIGDVDLSAGNGEPQKVKARVLSEEGERALNRIRRSCGDAYADAILYEVVQVSERDIIRWAEQSAEMIKNLGYWIVMKGWSLRKALDYEAKSIDSRTTVAELGDLARSRGGRAYVEYQDIHLTVEIANVNP